MASVDKYDERYSFKQSLNICFKEHQVMELILYARRITQRHKLIVLDHDRDGHIHDAEDGNKRCKSKRSERSTKTEWKNDHNAQENDNSLSIETNIRIQALQTKWGFGKERRKLIRLHSAPLVIVLQPQVRIQHSFQTDSTR